MRRKWGWIRDDEDSRDWGLPSNDSPFMSSKEVRLIPPGWDVNDQFGTSSCGAQAVIGATEVLVSTAGPKFLRTHYSPRFCYFNARRERAEKVRDTGSYIRDNLRVTRSLGVCPEYAWKFSSWRINQHPNANAYRAASRQHCYVKYYRIKDGHTLLIEQSIRRGLPVVMGFDSLFGGPHAVYCAGVRRTATVHDFLIVNSWGSSFGWKGTQWFPESTMREARSIWAVSL